MPKNECPLGGDTKDKCKDCVYSVDYQFNPKSGECLRRKTKGDPAVRHIIGIKIK